MRKWSFQKPKNSKIAVAFGKHTLTAYLPLPWATAHETLEKIMINIDQIYGCLILVCTYLSGSRASVIQVTFSTIIMSLITSYVSCSIKDCWYIFSPILPDLLERWKDNILLFSIASCCHGSYTTLSVHQKWIDV